MHLYVKSILMTLLTCAFNQEFRDEIKKTHEKLSDCTVVVKSIDAQPSLNNSIILSTVVELKGDKLSELFVQTFVLLGHVGNDGSSYHVINDIINYIHSGSAPAPEKKPEPAPKQEEVKTKPVEEPKPVVKEETKPAPVKQAPVKQAPVKQAPVKPKEDKPVVATSWASVVIAKPGEIDATVVITKPEDNNAGGDIKFDGQSRGKDEGKQTRDKIRKDDSRRGSGKPRGGRPRGGPRGPRRGGSKPSGNSAE